MRILFAVHDFQPPNHLLQPRAYLYRLGLAASAKGHCVTYLTNSSSVSCIDGLTVVSVDDLSGKNSAEILAAIRAIAPDVIVWSTSYLHVLGNSTLLADLPAPVFGFLACPSYSTTQLVRLIPRLGIGPLRYYFFNRLAQRSAVRRLLRKQMFAGFISQSRSNLRALGTLPAHCRIHIPPGLDHERWFPQANGGSRARAAPRRILFFGPARKSRGLDIVLQAFERCAKEHSGAELAIFLRDASSAEVEKVRCWLSARNLVQQATVAGGWTPPSELREAIWEADIVVIPFLLSESDSPISVLEAKACGRPVISSTVAGIPDLIGGGGVALRSCSVAAFAREISSLIAEPQRLRRLTEDAITETRAHPSWDSACDALISAMEATIDK